VKVKLDLHDISNHGTDMERALRGVPQDAVRITVQSVEIIPGKESGALKERGALGGRARLQGAERPLETALRRAGGRGTGWGSTGSRECWTDAS